MKVNFDSAGLPESASLPKYVFRYLSGDERSLASLAEGYLWFTKPSELNDPFDCQDTFYFNPGSPNLTAFARELLPPHARYPQAIERTCSLLLSDPKFQEEQSRALYRSAVEGINLCCFSEASDVPLMWAHYARAHTGMCLVFETTSLMNVSGKLSQPVAFNGLIVEYTENPSPIDWITLYGGPCTPQTDYRIRHVVFGRKTSEWDYEREIRFFSHRQGKNPFAPSSLVGAVFGAKSPENLKSAVRSIAGEKYPQALLAEVKLQRNSSTIIVEQFQSSYIEFRNIGIMGKPGEAHDQLYISNSS